MMFTRGSMTLQASAYLAQACTIATRYNCIRKQGFVDTSTNVSFKTPENTLIDYQIQQYRIFKQIGWAYAIKFVATWLIERFKELTGETSSSQGGNFVITNLESLPEIASTTAGFKAIATSITAEGIEDLRKTCGGVGYLLSSGIAALSADYVWRVTAEGDWIILMLQTARFIIKTIQRAKKGEKITGPYDYLSLIANPNFDVFSSKNAPKSATSVEDFFDLEYLENLFKYYALVTVSSVGLEVIKKVEETGNFDKAGKEYQVDLINAVKAHTYYFTFIRFRQTISQVTDKNIKAVFFKIILSFSL